MCEGTINAPTRMRRCYWKDFDEVPDSLPNKADVAVRFEEKEIRVGKLCFSDIEELATIFSCIAPQGPPVRCALSLTQNVPLHRLSLIALKRSL